MMAGVLGILKAGGAYAPLNPEDPVKRKIFMLRDTNASVLLTQQSLSWLENFSQCDARIVYMDREWENIAAEKVNDMEINISPANLAYVMYTSGSTGFPKGVCVVHRAVVRLVKHTNFAEFGVNDILLAFAPLSFDASTLEIWGGLLNGSRLVIFPSIKPSLEDLGKFIVKQTVTLLWLTAGLFHQMVENRLEDLKYVRRLLAGGDVLSPHYVRKVVVRFPGCRLINGYGPTENTTFTACCDLSSINKFESSVPIGRPVANTRVYILDLHMQPTPIGIKGELYTGGDGLGRGYLGRSELTAERFIPNPYGDTPGESLYKTGDIARYLADGNIEFLGRIDQQVKIRGFRIELGEIESTLTRHPGIKESAVLVQKNGSKTEQLTAYVVFKNKREPGRSELRGYLQERLPAYMVPSVFVELESLPLTPNGKIDRRVLPAPGNDRAGLEYPPAAPRTPTEKILVETWSQVLAVEQVGIFDDFFDLGGHSLLAMQLVLRISDAVGINIPMNKILEIPYIAGLADYIEINAGSKTYMADAPGAIPNNNREEGRI
jgi:aspartate racemase